jgi:beta-lactamase regulating signal transducer with metallopeptidase domain/Tol biopolymer transport system component
MVAIINECLNGLNHLGDAFSRYAVGAFLQSAVLVVVLFGIDLLLRKRVRAVFRYCIWLLVLVKLILPPTLSLPTGIGYWVPDRVPTGFVVPEHFVDIDRFEATGRPLPSSPQPSGAMLPVEPSAIVVEPDGPTMPAAMHLPPITGKAVLLLFWLAGVLAFAVVLAQRIRFVRGLVASGTAAQGPLLDLLEACRRQVGVRGRVELRTSEALSSPAVCGLLRPTILMPGSLVDKLSPDGLKATLIHELAHIKRADLWVNAVQTLLQVVYFYNPFVWLANAMIRRTCEEAVDETVLVALGGRASDYSNTLINISEMAFWKADFGLRLVGVAESKKALKRRIKHMLTRPIPQTARIGALGTIAILLIAAVLLPMARAERSNEQASTAAQETSRAADESDAIVDPDTGLKFTVAGRISAENDKIIHNNTVDISPNGKFLLWRGLVTPLDGGKPWRLTGNMNGVISWVAWSPDGKLIAYRSGSEIWLLPVAPETGQATGPARKLVDDPANWYGGAILWSADSQWVLLYYYERGKSPVEKCISVRDGRQIQPPDYTRFSLRSPDQKELAWLKPGNSVWTAPVGGGPTRLAVAGGRGMGTIPLWWSPDGEWLLCGETVRGYLFYNLFFVRLADRREVVLRFPEQVTGIGFRAVGLRVSPDGRKLRYFKNAHYLRLAAKVAPIGGGFAETSFARQFDMFDVYDVRAPQGQGLVFTGYKGRIFDKVALYAAPAGGGEPVEVKLNVPAGDLRSCLVSPDGRRLFTATVTTRGQETTVDALYVIPISLDKAQSTGPATRIFTDYRPPKGGAARPAWSPDSSRLAVCAKGEGDGDLYVVPADGGPAKQLTQSPEEVEQSPMWSPDGKFIAYCVNVPGGVSLYAIGAEGGAPKRLWTWTSPTARGKQRHTWFPDSKEIAVESDDGIVAVAVADGAARPFLKLADVGLTWLWWLQWSPDGQTLALFGGDDDFAAAFFRPSDRKVERLPSDAWIIDLGWTADSQALFCVAEQPDRIRPDALVYEVDLVEAWTWAKNSVAGASSPAGASPTAKREAPPLVNGEFRDDFEDGHTRYWAFEDAKTGGPDRVREVQNGELVLENTRATIGVPEWTNYVVTVKMRIKRTDGEVRMGASGVRFRSDEDGEYFLAAADRRSPRFGVCYRGAGQGERAGVLAESPYNFLSDAWYTIQARVEGPHITVSVDGRVITDVHDESCTQGAVALIADAGARVHFDDFSVRLLP